MLKIETVEELREVVAKVNALPKDDAAVKERVRFLEEVAAAGLDARMSRAFHEKIFDANPLAATGQGSIDMSPVIADPEFRRFLAERSLEPLPRDRAAKIEHLTQFADALLERAAAKCRVRPQLKIYRAMAALFPAEFTTIADRGSLRRLARRLFGGASRDIVAQHRRVLDRFEEALGPARGEMDGIFERMRLPWGVYALVRSGDDDETTHVDAESTGGERLVPLPAARRRRGLTSIKGSFPAMLSTMEFVRDGVTREQLLDFLRAGSPTSKAVSLGMTINVMQAEFTVIRLDGGVYRLTDRGRGVLDSGDPDDLADWLLTHILGFDAVLKEIQDRGPLLKAAVVARLKLSNPGWTTEFAPMSMVHWQRHLGLIDMTPAGYDLTDRGREWASRIHWTPENLSPEVDDAEDSTESVAVPDDAAEGRFDLPSWKEIYESTSDGVISFPETVVMDLHAGLWANARRHFAVLTGLSGSGKTQLARRYGRALAPSGQAEKHVQIVPVQPGWIDPSALFGFVNPLARPGEEKYVSTHFLKFLLRASEDPSRPYTVILDEMNLSHPEQYLAPLLSAMETGDAIALHHEREWYDGVPSKLPFPKNLAIIGTVNMDETTHGLSDKVLDRAFVIEFWTIDLERYPRWDGRNIPPQDIAFARTVLTRLMKALEPARLHFGWRVVDDVLDFLELGITQGRAAAEVLDSVVYAKVLPKLRGDDSGPLGRALDDSMKVLDDAKLVRCLAKAQGLRASLDASGTARFWR